MHGAVLLDEKGEVLRPAILWNDGRSGKECLELEETEPELRVITGNLAMPGFTAPKLLWVHKHEPQIFKQIHKVLLPKDYLRFKLSGETISDRSDSAGTLWLDTEKREWSEPMLSATHLSKDQMPTLVEGSEPGAQLSAKLTRSGAILEPCHCRRCWRQCRRSHRDGCCRTWKCLPIPWNFRSLFRRQPNLPAKSGSGRPCLLPLYPKYMASNGSHSQRFQLSELDCRRDPTERIELIENWNPVLSEPGNLCFLPYLSGERTPHNNPNAQGVFLGLKHEHGSLEMTQAVLEGVAYAFGDCQKVLLEAGAEIGEVSLIGGGSRSRLWGQILASVLNRPLNRHEGSELGPAQGAARLAMLAAGQGSLEQICTRPKISEVLEPQPSLVMHYQEKQEQYRKIYRSLETSLVGLFKGGLCFKHFFLEWPDFFPSRRKNILIVFLIVLHPFRLRADFLGIHIDLGKGVIKVLI
ncbi:MAG: hypothetical protein CM15mP88_3230 [Pseudomonadota bacterium]|nr:MAG: hypothetical protein CM15mP88_3230 [Pseudomonadota bacterium]